MTPTRKDLREAWETAERWAEASRSAYLRGAGWLPTNETPDKAWRWRKAMPDGTVMMMSAGEAASVQRALDPSEPA